MAILYTLRKQIILWLLCLPSLANGQDVEITIGDRWRAWRDKVHEEKMHNIVDYSDMLSLKFFSVRKSNEISHFDAFTQSEVKYKPNENVTIGLGVGYRWFALDLGFTLPGMNKDDDVFGKTERTDIQANIYMHKFVLDFNLQDYQGYYGSNPQLYDPTFDPMNPVYPIRPDIHTSNIGLSAFYIFNHEKFSYRAAFTFNEKQLHSAGSFLAGTYLNIYSLKAKDPLVPEALRDTFDPEADFRNTDFTIMGISGGYGYTLILFKNLYASMTLLFGLGPQTEHRKATTDLTERKDSRVVGRVVVRGALGYNGKRFFTGVSFVTVQSGGTDEEYSHLLRGVNNFKFFVGTRLHPPKFLRK